MFPSNTACNLRAGAEEAFARTTGARLIGGNRVRLLRDARENYPAWLEAIAAARNHIYFENYFIQDDDTGRRFAEALVAKARSGVRVRLIYDWLGSFGKASRGFWNRMRAAGVNVRCYNPPRLDSPFGWLSRDHRKALSVDGRVGFISGLCVGKAWEGIPEKKIEPWRDTGIELRGPSVAELERAFAQVWAITGAPIPDVELANTPEPEASGSTSLRIIASVPATAGLFRLDQLVAALARQRLWLTDAYFAGTSLYMQSLSAAARAGVDVRLLVPDGTDIPLIKPLSRSGYRPLLEAGVRIFEWKGTMLHAKTAVADGHWARVGSSNLNLASWMGNCEMDAAVEDAEFAQAMEAMYLEDLENATEIVLYSGRKARSAGRPHRHTPLTSGGGSAGRAAAGAFRIGNAVGAALATRRVLDPVESRLMAGAGAFFLTLALLAFLWPRILAYPLAALFAWLAAVLLYRGCKLNRENRRRKRKP